MIVLERMAHNKYYLRYRLDYTYIDYRRKCTPDIIYGILKSTISIIQQV